MCRRPFNTPQGSVSGDVYVQVCGSNGYRGRCPGVLVMGIEAAVQVCGSNGYRGRCPGVLVMGIEAAVQVC